MDPGCKDLRQNAQREPGPQSPGPRAHIAAVAAIATFSTFLLSVRILDLVEAGSHRIRLVVHSGWC